MIVSHYNLTSAYVYLYIYHEFMNHTDTSFSPCWRTVASSILWRKIRPKARRRRLGGVVRVEFIRYRGQRGGGGSVGVKFSRGTVASQASGVGSTTGETSGDVRRQGCHGTGAERWNCNCANVSALMEWHRTWRRILLAHGPLPQ